MGQDGSLEPSLIGRHDSFDSKTDGMGNNGKSAFGDERTKEKPSGSEARPKEGASKYLFPLQWYIQVLHKNY